MAKHLNRKVDEMSYDKLIAGLTPPVKVASGIIAALTAETVYPRGTALSKGADGKLRILGTAGENLIPDCVLCDEETIGTGDATAAVYVMGCFNEAALTVADGYTITEADRDKLRERGIYLSQVWD